MAKKRQENPAGGASAATTKPASTAKTVAPKKTTKKRVAGELPWHVAWRTLVSLLAVVHLLAVFCAPWDLLTQDTLPPGGMPLRFMSPQEKSNIPAGVVQQPLITRSLHRFFHDYLNLLYLNHGYEFFAPDPAGTHVIDYQVTQADGKVVEGRLPSHDEHWPRLLYHRHMMLAEQTQLIGPQSGQYYADHLATLHGGTSQMQLKVHLLLPPSRVADEMPLDDPSTYQVRSTATGRPRLQTRIDEPTPQQGAQP